MEVLRAPPSVTRFATIAASSRTAARERWRIWGSLQIEEHRTGDAKEVRERRNSWWLGLPHERAGIRLAAGLSHGSQAVEKPADGSTTHCLMHNRILLRRPYVSDGGKSCNTEENQHGELSEIHPISYSSGFSAVSLVSAT
jgi:hypothetical protein